MPEWARRSTWELVLAVILLRTIVFNLTQSSGYLSGDNFVSLFQLHIEKVIVVIPMTFVIIAGEIDRRRLGHGVRGSGDGLARRARRPAGARRRGGAGREAWRPPPGMVRRGSACRRWS